MKTPFYFDVFTAGNALMEATIRVDDATLKCIGVPKSSMLLTHEQQIIRLTHEWKKELQSFVPAGAECNVATGVAYLGGKSFFTGKIGSDESGMEYQKRLDELGVVTRLIQGAGLTGRILSFVTPDYERSMMTYLGEAARFSVQDLEMEQLPLSKMVFISAFFFQPESTRGTAFRVVEMARRNQIPIALDASDGILIHENGDLIKNVLEEYADIVFVNESELQAIGEISKEDPELYLGKHIPTLLVKKGPRGATVFAEGRSCHVDAIPANIVDTTGAGDAFASGFLLATIRGYSAIEAAKIGCIAASHVVAQYGSCLFGRVPDDFWK